MTAPTTATIAPSDASNPVLQGIELRRRCDSLSSFISAIDTLDHAPRTTALVDGSPITEDTTLKATRVELTRQLTRYTRELDALVNLYGGR